MLKNNSLLGIVYGVLFLALFLIFFVFQKTATDTPIVFSYPESKISFAGQEIPTEGEDYLNKQRFDKEFLLTSNNLYQFYLYVKRYPLYKDYIEQKLEEAGIHNDLKYLPIAESALRDDVVSSAGAGGIWQFMPDTARRFGLEVNEFVDERYHFQKSTDAAVEYLSDLYEIFGDWALVAAAYNRGENGLRRDMQSQGVDNYFDLYLNEETSRYVYRITAIKYVMLSYFEKQDLINKIIGGVHTKPNTEIVFAGKIDDLAAWSEENGYNYKTVKVMNRWIIGESLPDGDWEIEVLAK